MLSFEQLFDTYFLEAKKIEFLQPNQTKEDISCLAAKRNFPFQIRSMSFKKTKVKKKFFGDIFKDLSFHASMSFPDTGWSVDAAKRSVEPKMLSTPKNWIPRIRVTKK